MPGHMDKSKKNYLDMMKRMEKMDPDTVVREGEINSSRPAGMMGGIPTKRDMDPKSVVREGEMNALKGAVGAGMAGSLFDEMKKLDPQSTVRESEMMTQEMLSGLSMSDREAVEALTTMGISLEDALEAIMGVAPQTMTEGALGALPERDLPMPRPDVKPESFGQDTTQSMEMQKPMNT
tara:strand:- start:1936 stop:2472 length:537 start_codon:yes stop_codon:yes gene_type:complete